MELLYVEDITIAREGVAQKLIECGYTVYKASNGKEAVKVALDKKPLIVILDINLPNLNGIEVIRQIRKGYNPYIIICSGESKKDTVIEAIKLGARDYVSKPYEFSRLRLAIKKAELSLLSNSSNK